MKILTPTGHLGYTPIQEESFTTGMARNPDAIIADSGSDDIGPYPLGADVRHSPRDWQVHDLELMLLAARRLKVPMIVGSASDTGTDRGVNEFVETLRDLARKHRLEPFKLAAIYSEQQPEDLVGHLPLEGLSDVPPLDEATLRRTNRIVAVMGPEPTMAALERGADVVVAGRSCDDAIFSAFCLRHRMPRDLAMLLGKTLECASLCAEPFMVNQSIMGHITPEEIVVEPMHPKQRCTPLSVAGHALYERRDPYHLRGPGGMLDLTACRYEALDERRTRVTGPRFIADPVYKVKLEGAAYVGAHAVMFLGIRDPVILEHLGEVIAFARRRARRAFPDVEFRLFFHPYGKGLRVAGVSYVPRDLGLLLEVVAPDDELAREIALLTSRNIFFAEFGGQMATAGGAAQLFDEAVSIKPAYQWTVHHVIPVSDPLELFRTELLTIDGRSEAA